MPIDGIVLLRPILSRHFILLLRLPRHKTRLLPRIVRVLISAATIRDFILFRYIRFYSLVIDRMMACATCSGVATN